MQITNSLHQITYPLVETFHSVQGEGAWTGVNAFFIRLAGCDVGCPWCDTKKSWHAAIHPQRSLKDITQELKSVKTALVVITGGEPLMHDLEPLTIAIDKLNRKIHLETSGAHSLSGRFDWITLSPKKFKPPHPSIYSQANELKIVVASPADLEWAELQASKTPPATLKYLQPEWSAANAPNIIMEYILKHPDWRISLQTHKFLGVR